MTCDPKAVNSLCTRSRNRSPQVYSKHATHLISRPHKKVLRNSKIDAHPKREIITLLVKRINNVMEGGKAILLGSQLVLSALIVHEGLNEICCR